ncbi:MAG: hypothetical protein KF862_02010 [Chitinophagaceae bacterium]|nr:hypothetical protein [Chitinophagaceae bacterium]
MPDEGTKGFEGGMNARKYTGITKTSKATATGDWKQALLFRLAREDGVPAIK